MPTRFGVNAPLAIEVEIRKEKASALKRVANKLESLIEELKTLETQAVALAGDARASLLRRHAEVRAEAEKQQWYLIVQREAMGLSQHRDVYELYPIPPKLK